MENKILKKSFEPIINDKSKILILGSLPSDKSIIANEYYGNKTNQFWDIISLIFEKEIECCFGTIISSLSVSLASRNCDLF